MRKLVLPLLLAAAMLHAGVAAADECLEGDCYNGVGTGFTEEGKIYRGEWRNGFPHGIGRLTISKERFIEGRWEKGVLVEEKKP